MENNNEGTTMPTNDTETQNTQTVNYEQEYRKQLLEIEKLKNAISKTNSENAEYKRKEAEKMTDEEKKAKELQELIDSKNKIEAELQTMKLEKDLLANGFSAEESAKLIRGNFSVKDIADIVKTRLEVQEKSLRAELIKDTTPSAPLGTGTTSGGKTKSDYALFQETKAKRSTSGKVEF